MGLFHLVYVHCAFLFSPLPVSPFKGPRNLQTSEPTRTSFRVTWDHAPGDVKGYKVTFHPVGEDIDLGELMVGPYDNTVVLEELRCVLRLISQVHMSFEEYSPVYHIIIINLSSLLLFFLGLQSWYQILSECVWHV